MATATVLIDKDNLLEENAREMREILASSFSEARRRLDEREAQLSLRLEEKVNEVRIHNKSNNTDREQLKSVLEFMQSGLSSNTKPILEKINKLESEQLEIQFNWSPQNLYEEINKMGEVCSYHSLVSLYDTIKNVSCMTLQQVGTGEGMENVQCSRITEVCIGDILQL